MSVGLPPRPMLEQLNIHPLKSHEKKTSLPQLVLIIFVTLSDKIGEPQPHYALPATVSKNLFHLLFYIVTYNTNFFIKLHTFLIYLLPQTDENLYSSV